MSRPARVKLFRTVSQGTARAFVVLAVVAVVVSGTSSWLAVRAVRGEIASRASVTQLCQAQAKQVTFWAHLVQITPPPPHETAAQKQQRLAKIAAFLAYVRQQFAPHEC